MTLDSLLDMFRSAKDIMGWLADCASVVAGEDKPVKWATPLGLPVIQPYRCGLSGQPLLPPGHASQTPPCKSSVTSSGPNLAVHFQSREGSRIAG